MKDHTEHAIQLIQHAKASGFRGTQVRTERLDPPSAAEVIRHLPNDDGFDCEKVAAHVESLPAATGLGVQITKSASRLVLAASIPGPARGAFEWAEKTEASMSASGIKLNFGPDKPTDLKIFWGKPDINTLIDIGGEEE